MLVTENHVGICCSDRQIGARSWSSLQKHLTKKTGKAKRVAPRIRKKEEEASPVLETCQTHTCLDGRWPTKTNDAATSIAWLAAGRAFLIS
jgi:hypothetical protein